VEQAEAPRPTWPYRPRTPGTPSSPPPPVQFESNQNLTIKVFFLSAPLFSVSWGTAGGTPPTLAASSGLSPTAVAVVAVALLRRCRDSRRGGRAASSCHDAPPNAADAMPRPQRTLPRRECSLLPTPEPNKASIRPSLFATRRHSSRSIPPRNFPALLDWWVSSKPHPSSRIGGPVGTGLRLSRRWGCSRRLCLCFTTTGSA
jgi:hypothetical protein